MLNVNNEIKNRKLKTLDNESFFPTNHGKAMSFWVKI